MVYYVGKNTPKTRKSALPVCLSSGQAFSLIEPSSIGIPIKRKLLRAHRRKLACGNPEKRRSKATGILSSAAFQRPKGQSGAKELRHERGCSSVEQAIETTKVCLLKHQFVILA